MPYRQVDMSGALTNAGLTPLFPTDVWPPMAATRELATKLRSLKKAGQEKVYLFADLRK